MISINIDNDCSICIIIVCLVVNMDINILLMDILFMIDLVGISVSVIFVVYYWIILYGFV